MPSILVSLIVALCFGCEPFIFKHSTGKPNKEPEIGLGKCHWCPFDPPLAFSARLTVSGLQKF